MLEGFGCIEFQKSLFKRPHMLGVSGMKGMSKDGVTSSQRFTRCCTCLLLEGFAGPSSGRFLVWEVPGIGSNGAGTHLDGLRYQRQASFGCQISFGAASAWWPCAFTANEEDPKP